MCFCCVLGAMRPMEFHCDMAAGSGIVLTLIRFSTPSSIYILSNVKAYKSFHIMTSNCLSFRFLLKGNATKSCKIYSCISSIAQFSLAIPSLTIMNHSPLTKFLPPRRVNHTREPCSYQHYLRTYPTISYIYYFSYFDL